MNWRIRFAVTYSVLAGSVYLLLKERFAVYYNYESKMEIDVLANLTDFNSMLNQFDLTDEMQQQMFLNRTRMYYRSKLHQYLSCLPLQEIDIFRGKTLLNISSLRDELIDYFNMSFYSNTPSEMNTMDSMMNAMYSVRMMKKMDSMKMGTTMDPKKMREMDPMNMTEMDSMKMENIMEPMPEANPMNMVSEMDSMKPMDSMKMSTAMDLMMTEASLMNMASMMTESNSMNMMTEMDSMNTMNPMMNTMNMDTASQRISLQQLKLAELVFLGAIKSKNFLIYRNQFCFVLDYHFYLGLSRLIFENARHYVYASEFYDFVELDKESEDVEQVFILNTKNPALKCTSKKEKRNISRTECLFGCFKMKNRLSRYYYMSNEPEPIRLDFEMHSADLDRNALMKNESDCFNQCKGQGKCKLIYSNKVNSSFPISMTMVKAEPVISANNFRLQLVGLILSFIGICVYKLTFKIVSLCLRIHEFSENKIMGFKILFTFMCTYFMFAQVGKVVKEYKREVMFPAKNEISTRLLEFEPINLALCVHVNARYPGYHMGDAHMDALTYAELESRTNDAFDRTVDGIYLEFLNKRFNVSWQLMRHRVLFFKLEQNLLSRCFLLRVEPEEAKYQSILSSTRLTIDFKHEDYSLFLVPDMQNFHSMSYRYRGHGEPLKVVRGSTWRAENCKHYGRMYEKCNSRWNCFDQCVHNKTVGAFTMFNLNVSARFIDKELFDRDQWNNRKLLRNDDTDKIYSKIESDCRMAFKNVDCMAVSFKDSPRIQDGTGNMMENRRKVQFNLYYDQVKSSIGEPDLYKVVLDLISVQTVVFNINIFEFSTIIYVFMRYKLNVMENKFYLVAVYLVCSAGLLVHIWFVYYQVKHDDMIWNQFYEQTESVQLPQVAFCLDYDLSSIENALMGSNLTGRHLEEMTMDLRPERIFEEIIFRNESNMWTSLKITENFSSPDISIASFYLLSKKCFSIKPRMITLAKRSFFFENSTDVLKFNFNRSFIRSQNVSFLTKKLNKPLELSRPIHLNLRNASYTVLQEMFDIDHDDRFIYIKNPHYFFENLTMNYLNNIDGFLANLKNKFKMKHNMATLAIPLTEENFDLPIDDQKFDEFFRMEDQMTRNQTVDPNYQRQFDINYLEEFDQMMSDGSPRPDFTFKLLFLRKKIKVETSDNWGKLILNTMNVLSLWLNLNLFDSFFCKVIFNYLQESTAKKDPTKDPSIPGSPVSTRGPLDSFKHKEDPIGSISATLPQTNLTKPDPDKDEDQYAGEYEGTDFSVSHSTYAKDFSVHYLTADNEAGEDERSSVSSRSRQEDDPFKTEFETEFVKLERQVSLSLDDLYGEANRPLEASEPFSTSLEAILTDVDQDGGEGESKPGKKRLLKKHVTFHWS